MPVIAVINRKGGSGKSTLATHLAAYCANRGMPVMLGDVDRQQSTQTWLKLRDARGLPQRAPLVGWVVDPRNVLRPPAGITRVVLDTPGGLRGLDLARVAMYADAVLMPVCNSVFDRTSAAECHAELMALPRVSAGRCKVAAIGMRLDARTKAAEVLQEWAGRLSLPFIGVLRETQAYVRCVEQGLTLFDMPAAQVQADLAQWKPILDWLEPVLNPVVEAAPPRPVPRVASVAVSPQREATVHRQPPLSELLIAPERRRGGWLDWLALPRLFQR
ncbi:ParA family protein [Piscinibacter sp. XHJ-5]|uniref:ParA family protein n=1 Tax=Piscinibacter sp. XHJ-5 TaxID=3037797 RepID=UPI0024534980|nr:ParA family protein [Piscinibacter sp. XHJ-5]